MRLELTMDDLLAPRSGINCSETRFDDFKPEVQAAIKAVGKAIFLDNGGTNYNAIYPPKEKVVK